MHKSMHEVRVVRSSSSVILSLHAMHIFILGRAESSDSWDDIRIFTYSICMSTLCRRVCAVHEWWANTKSMVLLTCCSYCNRQKQALKVCIHYVVCLTTGPYPLPKRAIQRVRSSASSLSYSIFFFSEGQSVAAYIFFLDFSFLLSFLQ
jgi:hypothetical protein